MQVREILVYSISSMKKDTHLKYQLGERNAHLKYQLGERDTHLKYQLGERIPI